MGRIKKVRFISSKFSARDRWGKTFAKEFESLADGPVEKLQELQDMFVKNKERLVTVTIKDEETGQEWVIERVRLFKEKPGRVGD